MPRASVKISHETFSGRERLVKQDMAVLTRRTRIVSFRVSEEEYQDLVSLCLRRQARSISDFARLVTLSQFQPSRSDAKPESALDEIHRQLGAIDRELRKLSGLIEPQRFEEAGRLDALQSPLPRWGGRNGQDV
jgi:hypothetical protein